MLLAALMLSSVLALQEKPAAPAEKTSSWSSRGVTLEVSPEGRIELTVRRRGKDSCEDETKTYRADSFEEFRKKYPEIAREYPIEGFLASPDGGDLFGAWNPWPTFWPEALRQWFEKSRLAMPTVAPPKSRMFGVQVAPVDEPLAAQMDLGAGEGVLVRHVQAGSAAEKSGLRAWDVILTMNGKTVAGPEAFRKEIQEQLPKGFELEILRRGKRETLKVGAEKS